MLVCANEAGPARGRHDCLIFYLLMTAVIFEMTTISIDIKNNFGDKFLARSLQQILSTSVANNGHIL